MKPELEPPGSPAQENQFKTEEGRQFARFLRLAGAQTFTQLIELRRTEIPPADVVVFRTASGRPQRPTHLICREELLAAVFPDDGDRPKVYALRSDFPQVPHVNLEAEEFPRSLCLYDQAHDIIRLTWTPASFLERIRFWLRRTANGTLHGEDQPLEPLLASSNVHFVFPPGFLATSSSKTLHILRDVRAGDSRTILSTWEKEEAAFVNGDGGTRTVQIAVFELAPQTHGIIRKEPKTLAVLDVLTREAGLPLAESLTQKLQNWQTAGVLNAIGKRELLLMLVLPKRRSSQVAEEATEYRAFLLQKSIHEVAHLLGVFSGKSARACGEIEIPPGSLEKIGLQICQTHLSPSPRMAASLNGTSDEDKLVTAIGAGALGSQSILNLIRAGWGRWVVIDPDILYPHNLARHALDGFYVGYHKATSLEQLVHSVYPEVHMLQGIPDDVMRPEYPQTESALRQAKLILDFSASVPVSRYLAARTGIARVISGFTSPQGECLIILVEDAQREIRLDWLEMLHYRAVLGQECLSNTLTGRDGRYRYSAGCRDVSTIIAQDDMALWGATCARAIRPLDSAKQATIRIYHRHEDGRVDLHTPKVSKPLPITLDDVKLDVRWTIRLDDWLLKKLGSFRELRLPNETGGVLLGVFDTNAKVCSIVDALPSPPDSREWPTSYIRGCEGLAMQVRAAQVRTAEQVTYVGEWHSHPDGCSTRPSNDDMQANTWLMGHMGLEGLPAIMMIVGQHQEYRLVTAV